MRKHLLRWEIAGFVFTCVLGTLLHIFYAWSGENALAAAVSSVNESTWEHMKLLFVPFFLFTMAEGAAFSDAFRNYFAAKAAAMWIGLACIPTLFYLFSGAFGELPAWVNIAIFYLSAALMYFASSRLLTAGALSGGGKQILGFLALFTLAFLFVLFTYRTPHLPLFADPRTLCYGIACRK